MNQLTRSNSGNPLFKNASLRRGLAQRVLLVIIPVWILVATLIYIGGYDLYLREREQAHQQYYTLANTSLENARERLLFLGLQIHQFIQSSRTEISATTTTDSPGMPPEIFLDRYWNVIRQQREELEISFFNQHNVFLKHWGDYIEQENQIRLTPFEKSLFEKIEYGSRPVSYLDCRIVCYYNLITLANQNNKAYGKLKFRIPVDFIFRLAHRRHNIQYAIAFTEEREHITQTDTPTNHQLLRTLVVHIDNKRYRLFPIVREDLFGELFRHQRLSNTTNLFQYQDAHFAATPFLQHERSIDTPQPYQLIVLEDVSERHRFIFRNLLILALVTVLILALLVLGIYSLTASPIRRLAVIADSLKLIGMGQYQQASEHIRQHISQANMAETDAIQNNIHRLTEELQNLEAHNQQKQRYLSRLAEEDPLTQLPNRRALNRLLNEYQQQRQVFSLLLIDVNYFKIFNDSYGHDVGDQLLRQLGQLLSQHTTETSVAGRSGGDEFFILYRHSGPCYEDAEILAGHVISAAQKVRLGELTDMADDGLKLSLSIGISHFPLHTHGIKELLTYADIAMYECKRDRIGAYRVYTGREEMLERLKQAKYWRDQLHSAISNRRLHAYFQGIVDVKTHKVIAQEALARIESNGTIYTAEKFIDAIANQDSVVQLDIEMLKISIPLFVQYYEGQLLFINLSSLSINRRAFVDVIREQLATYPSIQHHIVFEISEKTAITDFPLTIKFMQELRRLGVRFALDDFGQGHSSLLLLHDLPISYLKLDRSFITSLQRQPIMLKTLKSIVSICHSLQVEVIAEGLETQAQCELLSKLGINYLQGYYFSLPDSIDQQRSYPETAGIQSTQSTI